MKGSQHLTSAAVKIAEVWEAPKVAQADGVADARYRKLIEAWAFRGGSACNVACGASHLFNLIQHHKPPLASSIAAVLLEALKACRSLQQRLHQMRVTRNMELQLLAPRQIRAWATPACHRDLFWAPARCSRSWAGRAIVAAGLSACRRTTPHQGAEGPQKEFSRLA